MIQLLRFLALVVLIVSATPVAAQIYVPASDGDFSLFSDGDLAGQHGWSAVTTTPTGMQVSGGKVVTLGGQLVDPPDVRYTFAAPVPGTAGSTFYIGLNFRVTQLGSNSPTFGSDFVGGQTAAGEFGPRLAYGRVIGSTGYTFQLSGGTPQPPSSALIYLSDDVPRLPDGILRVIVAYDFISGSINDQISIYLDPTSPIRANNTPLFTFFNSSGLGWADLGNLTGLNLSVGLRANTSEIGRVTAAGSFGEAYSFITVPEPSSLALAALGVGLFSWRRARCVR
jgi:hypothetical protein